jgi:hypothetical protein
MAEMVLIVGVNDLEDQLAALQDWFERKYPGQHVHRGPWEAVRSELATSGSVVLLSDFWESTEAFKTTIEKRGFGACLFLLDSKVRNDDDGEHFLTGLLDSLGGEWWAAILSGKISNTVDTHVRDSAGERGVPNTTIEQHYLGASQDWFGDAKSLITQVLQRADKGESLQGWRPELARAKPDQLRAAVHWLASLALPLELDLQTLQDRSAGELGLAELIWGDYFGAGAESYLGERSTCHESGVETSGGVSVETALDSQWKRLADSLGEQEGGPVKSAFEEVSRTLVEARGREVSGIAGSLETVVAAIRKAQSIVGLLLEHRLQEQE